MDRSGGACETKGGPDPSRTPQTLGVRPRCGCSSTGLDKEQVSVTTRGVCEQVNSLPGIYSSTWYKAWHLVGTHEKRKKLINLDLWQHAGLRKALGTL